TVRGKLADADAQRLRRVRAAARILHARVTADATPNDRMASARRRAAARLLLERDRDERTLLAAETQQLQAAEVTMQAATTTLPEITLPESLLKPVKGTLARHFGSYVHDASKATLSRHGLDFECDEGAPVIAPADGTVRYAGIVRGLDHGVILDHGGYLTVLAKLDTVALPVGAKVSRGDRIGHAARHRVYFEVRAKVGPGGLPIDPEPLLDKK
ncbi:MAG TPA: peptidoglycan DD-metalloendopeptidase family protein, partial [Kofleriaceae bacterium]|nr:peptidoglycan DD-metalloendopeptidase family protein [Kofleriaceae bacterium]